MCIKMAMSDALITQEPESFSVPPVKFVDYFSTDSTVSIQFDPIAQFGNWDRSGYYYSVLRFSSCFTSITSLLDLRIKSRAHLMNQLQCSSTKLEKKKCGIVTEIVVEMHQPQLTTIGWMYNCTVFKRRKPKRLECTASLSISFSLLFLFKYLKSSFNLQ